MDKHGEPQGTTSLNLSRLEDSDSQSHTLYMNLRVIGPGAGDWEHCKDAEGRPGHLDTQVQKLFAFI